MTDDVTVGQTAHMLGVSPIRVRQLIAEGKLSCSWTPLGRLIPKQEVLELARVRRERAARGRGS